jgi:DNA-binding transcriptional regulator YiaG
MKDLMKIKIENLIEWKDTPPALPKWNANKSPKAVKEWRLKHNFSKTDLAKMLGVSVPAVVYMENGQRNPSGPVLRLLQLFEALKS